MALAVIRQYSHAEAEVAEARMVAEALTDADVAELMGMLTGDVPVATRCEAAVLLAKGGNADRARKNLSEALANKAARPDELAKLRFAKQLLDGAANDKNP
jgi:hypothetical protein